MAARKATQAHHTTPHHHASTHQAFSTRPRHGKRRAHAVGFGQHAGLPWFPLAQRRRHLAGRRGGEQRPSTGPRFAAPVADHEARPAANTRGSKPWRRRASVGLRGAVAVTRLLRVGSPGATSDRHVATAIQTADAVAGAVRLRQAVHRQRLGAGARGRLEQVLQDAVVVGFGHRLPRSALA